MTNTQLEIIQQALTDYLGWFDSNDPEDQVTIDAINVALNDKDPLNIYVTSEALMSYQDYLSNTIEQNAQFQDYGPEDIEAFKADLITVKDLLSQI